MQYDYYTHTWGCEQWYHCPGKTVQAKLKNYILMFMDELGYITATEENLLGLISDAVGGSRKEKIRKVWKSLINEFHPLQIRCREGKIYVFDLDVYFYYHALRNEKQFGDRFDVFLEKLKERVRYLLNYICKEEDQ